MKTLLHVCQCCGTRSSQQADGSCSQQKQFLQEIQYSDCYSTVSTHHNWKTKTHTTHITSCEWWCKQHQRTDMICHMIWKSDPIKTSELSNVDSSSPQELGLYSSHVPLGMNQKNYGDSNHSGMWWHLQQPVYFCQVQGIFMIPMGVIYCRSSSDPITQSAQQSHSRQKCDQLLRRSVAAGIKE